MDIRMPTMDGIEATRHITSSPLTAGVRVLVLTTFAADDYVVAALRAGASGFVLKDTEPRDLVHAVRVLAAGDALLAPEVTRRMLDRFARGEREALVLPPLTQREHEVLVAVALRLSNELVGRRHDHVRLFVVGADSGAWVRGSVCLRTSPRQVLRTRASAKST